MEIGTPVIAFCAELAFVGGALARDIGLAVPAVATKLLLALLGEAIRGRCVSAASGRGRTGRNFLSAVHLSFSRFLLCGPASQSIESTALAAGIARTRTFSALHPK